MTFVSFDADFGTYTLRTIGLILISVFSAVFQVIAERAEKAAVIVTTNLPFSEWTQVIPNARLCKALIDRITDRAYIIETGAESYRFRRTLEKRKGRASMNTSTSAAPAAEKKANVQHGGAR